MVAKKKSQQDAGVADESPAPADTAVAPLAATTGGHVYRTDLGESLPPQKYAGVE